MPNEFPYDVFLSHSSKDKPVVRWRAHASYTGVGYGQRGIAT